MFRGRSSEWDYGFFVGGAEQPGAVPMLGDVVRLQVPDDYVHLGEKVLAALQWTLEHVEAEFILKVDEDTWVHADRLALWLRTIDANQPGGWYGGMVHRAPVQRAGKWSVPSGLYSASEYPA